MDFHSIDKLHAAFPFSCMQRKGTPYSKPKSEWHIGVCDLWAFKLDHLESTKPIFITWISTLLIDQDTNFWKANFHCINKPHWAFPFSCRHRKGHATVDPESGPHKWMTQRGARPWGIQVGPFGVNQTYFCNINFHFIHKPHAAFPFSCMQRKGQASMDLESGWQRGVQDPGAFKLNHLESTKPIFAL